MRWHNLTTEKTIRYEFKEGNNVIAIVQEINGDYYLKEQITNKSILIKKKEIRNIEGVFKIAEKLILDICKSEMNSMGKVLCSIESKKDLEKNHTIKLKYGLGEILYYVSRQSSGYEIEAVLFVGVKLEDGEILLMFESIDNKDVICLEEDNVDIYREYKDAEYECAYRKLNNVRR